MIPPATATKQTEGCATPQANIELHQLRQIRHSTQAKQCNISGFILPFLFERVIVVINASSLVNHNSEVPLSIFCRFLSRAAVKAKRTEFKKFRRRCKWCGLRRGLVAVAGGIILWTGRRLGTASEADLKSFGGRGKKFIFFSKFNKQAKTHASNF